MFLTSRSFQVSVSGCIVSLPTFFQWFVDDFAAPGSSGDAAMLLWVSRFCDARVAGQLRRIGEMYFHVPSQL
jgi:hypothetical protein